MNRVAWTDDPLSGANDTTGAYFKELQNNTNYAQGFASVGLTQWTNASAGQKLQKVHYQEIQNALQDPALLSFYGHGSIESVIGRPLATLPRNVKNNADLAGYALLNDLRAVLDALIPPITFVFGAIWTESEGGSFVYDQTPFAFTVTAYRSGVVLESYAQACTVESDQPSDSGNTIAAVGWVAGVATVSAMEVVFSGTPDAVLLTCTDDASGLDTGNTTAPTNTASPVNSGVCGLYYGCRSGYVDDDVTSQESALAAAIAIYDNTPTYDDIDAGLINPFERFGGSGVDNVFTAGKAQRPKTVSSAPFAYGIGYGIAMARLDASSFTGGKLFLKLEMHTPNASIYNGYDAVALVVTTPQTGAVYSTASGSAGSQNRWAAAVVASELISVPDGDIPDGATVYIDLGITKSSLSGGLLQVFFRPDYSEVFNPSEHVDDGYWYGKVWFDTATLEEYA